MRLKYMAVLPALLAVPAVLAQADDGRLHGRRHPRSRACSASAKARSTTTCRSTSATGWTSAGCDEALRALYATGFFRDVELRRDGSTLLVVVHERPSIESFTIKGNKDIKTEDLEKSLRNVGLAHGQDLQPLDARRGRRAS